MSDRVESVKNRMLALRDERDLAVEKADELKKEVKKLQEAMEERDSQQEADERKNRAFQDEAENVRIELERLQREDKSKKEDLDRVSLKKCLEKT